MILTLPQARRIALAAQGFGRSRPRQVTMRQFQGVIDRLGVFQIDSVNVVARAHLLPVFARLGSYDTRLWDRAGSGCPPRLMEFWAHEAALIPPATWALLHARRRCYASPSHYWGGVLVEHRSLADEIVSLVAQRPMSAREMHAALGHRRGPKTGWGWNWTQAKQVAEALFATGELVVSRRNAQFERLYDLPQRVVPTALMSPTLDDEDAAVELVRIAARALGIATVRCLADYFRLRRDTTAKAVGLLAAAGELIPVDVVGWPREVYLHAEAARPRRIAARALLAPFDPLVWERSRLEELFAMHYRISIYTPAAKREHGYYVLPFLLDEALVGRVDLKADRSGSRLIVRTAFAEPNAPRHTAAELAAELATLATWLGLGRIVIDDDPKGDLIAAVGREL